MAETKPDWAYWRALADTSVSLRRCIALSLDLNPVAFGLPAVANDILMRRYEFPGFVDEKTQHHFNYRLRILAAHRLHGRSFSATPPAQLSEPRIFLVEFAVWAAQQFGESGIPSELKELAEINKEPPVIPLKTTARNPALASRSSNDQAPESTSSDEDAVGTKPGRMSVAQQQGFILKTIRSCCHDPKRLPATRPGYAGIKAEIADICAMKKGAKKSDALLTQSQFKKRWQELLSRKELIERAK